MAQTAWSDAAMRSSESAHSGHRHAMPASGVKARLLTAINGRTPKDWTTRGSPASWWRRVRRPRRAQTPKARQAGLCARLGRRHAGSGRPLPCWPRIAGRTTLFPAERTSREEACLPCCRGKPGASRGRSWGKRPLAARKRGRRSVAPARGGSYTPPKQSGCFGPTVTTTGVSMRPLASQLSTRRGSSGDMQESCSGLARVCRFRGSRALSGVGCAPDPLVAVRSRGSCPTCPVVLGSCGWSGRVYARNEAWISAALPDRGCTEGLCLTRSSRSQPAQRAVSGGGS